MTALINGIDFDNMTREEAVAVVGEQSVCEVERENCDFTNGVRDDGLTEFAASVKATDRDGESVTLRAMYYQPSDDVDGVEDLSDLKWVVDHYRVG